MVRMGDTWDRTTALAGERGGAVAAVAVLALFVPTAIRDAVAAFGGGGRGAAGLVALISLVALVATIWGQLAIVAIGVTPALPAAAARRQATARLVPALGVGLVMGIAISLLVLPGVVALARSGVTMAALGTASVNASDLPGLTIAFVSIYSLVVLILGVAIFTRLALLLPVVEHERPWFAAFGRSFRLTRGLSWRLFGVLLLFGIVYAVALAAAQLVVGAIGGVLTGGNDPDGVRWVAGLAGSAVATTFTALANLFTGRLYAALVGGARPA